MRKWNISAALGAEILQGILSGTCALNPHESEIFQQQLVPICKCVVVYSRHFCFSLNSFALSFYCDSYCFYFFMYSRQQKTIKSFSTRVEHTSKSVPEVCLQDPRTHNVITGDFALTSSLFRFGLWCVPSCFSSFVSFYFILFLFFYLQRVLKRLKLCPKTGW